MKNILVAIGGATVGICIFKAGRIYGLIEAKKIIEEPVSRRQSKYTSYRDFYNSKEEK